MAVSKQEFPDCCVVNQLFHLRITKIKNDKPMGFQCYRSWKQRLAAERRRWRRGGVLRCILVWFQRWCWRQPICLRRRSHGQAWKERIMFINLAGQSILNSMAQRPFLFTVSNALVRSMKIWNRSLCCSMHFSWSCLSEKSYLWLIIRYKNHTGFQEVCQ